MGRRNFNNKGQHANNHKQLTLFHRKKGKCSSCTMNSNYQMQAICYNRIRCFNKEQTMQFHFMCSLKQTFCKKEDRILLATYLSTFGGTQETPCGNDVSGCSYYKEELIKFELLKRDVIETLSNYLDFFRRGMHNVLRENIENIDPLVEYLYNPNSFFVGLSECVQYDLDVDLFEQYKSFLFMIIDEFKQIVSVTKINENLVAHIETLEESDRILKDAKLLKEYIDTYYVAGAAHTNSLFHIEKKLQTTLKIKPEYLAYIKKHGAPEGGIFETEKLQAIRNELNNVAYPDLANTLLCD